MRYLLTSLVLFWTLPLSAEPEPVPDNRKQLQELEGVWQLESVQTAKGVLNEEELRETLMQGESLIIIRDGKVSLPFRVGIPEVELQPGQQPGLFSLVRDNAEVQAMVKRQDGKLLVQGGHVLPGKDLNLGRFEPTADSVVLTFSLLAPPEKLDDVTASWQGTWILAGENLEGDWEQAAAFVIVGYEVYADRQMFDSSRWGCFRFAAFTVPSSGRPHQTELTVAAEIWKLFADILSAGMQVGEKFQGEKLTTRKKEEYLQQLPGKLNQPLKITVEASSGKLVCSVASQPTEHPFAILFTGKMGLFNRFSVMRPSEAETRQAEFTQEQQEHEASERARKQEYEQRERESAAEAALSSIQKYFLTGPRKQPAKARDHLQKLIEKYSGTAAATKAAELLKTVR